MFFALWVMSNWHRFQHSVFFLQVWYQRRVFFIKYFQKFFISVLLSVLCHLVFLRNVWCIFLLANSCYTFLKINVLKSSEISVLYCFVLKQWYSFLLLIDKERDSVSQRDKWLTESKTTYITFIFCEILWKSTEAST